MIYVKERKLNKLSNNMSDSQDTVETNDKQPKKRRYYAPKSKEAKERITPKYRDTAKSRIKRTAILEVTGAQSSEMANILGVSRNTIMKYKKEAYERGEVDKLHDKIVDSVALMAEERKRLAAQCYEIANKKAASILHNSENNGTDIELKEADFALRAISETEYSGKKAEPPKIEINVRRDATLNIQQNLADINAILERSGLDLTKIVSDQV